MFHQRGPLNMSVTPSSLQYSEEIFRLNNLLHSALLSWLAVPFLPGKNCTWPGLTPRNWREWDEGSSWQWRVALFIRLLENLHQTELPPLKPADCELRREDLLLVLPVEISCCPPQVPTLLHIQMVGPHTSHFSQSCHGSGLSSSPWQTRPAWELF